MKMNMQDSHIVLDSFSNDELRHLKQVLDAVARQMDLAIEDGSDQRIVFVPYNHFPSSLDRFEVNRLVDHFLGMTSIPRKPSEKDGVALDFSLTKSTRDFYSYREWIKKKCLGIANSKKNSKPLVHEAANFSQENSGDLKIELKVGELESYSDGSIKYSGTPVKMRNQIKDLCRLFMKKPGRLLTIDDIKDALIKADKRKTTPFVTISKYVSELRNSLRIHFKKDVFLNQKEEGWFFNP